MYPGLHTLEWGILHSMRVPLLPPVRNTKITLFILLIGWVLFGLGFLYFGKFQDGGWYTCAAKTVLRGLSPFEDFYYPHTPHYLWSYATLLSWMPNADPFWGRILHILLSTLTLCVCLHLLVREARDRLFWFVMVLLLNPYMLQFLFQIKSYALIQLLLLGSLWQFLRGNKEISYSLLAILSMFRISFLPLLPLYIWLDRRHFRPTALLAYFIPFLTLFSLDWEVVLKNLFLPIPWPVLSPNLFNHAYLESNSLTLVEVISEKIGYILRSSLIFIPFLLTVHCVKPKKIRSLLLGLFVIILIAHLPAQRPFDEYLAPVFLPLYLILFLHADFGSFRIRNSTLFLLIFSACVTTWRGYRRLVFPSQIQRIETVISELEKVKPGKRSLLFSFDGYLNSFLKEPAPLDTTMGRFSLQPNFTPEQARSLKVVHPEFLWDWIATKKFSYLLLSDSEIHILGHHSPGFLNHLKSHYTLVQTFDYLLEVNEKTHLWEWGNSNQDPSTPISTFR